jgi:exonuclease III
MRIATLNIDKGGGQKERREPLWDLVLELDRTFELDCIVFTEFKSKNGPWLCEEFKRARFTCVSHTTIPDTRGSSGVPIAAKSPFKARENPADFNVHGERMLHATFDHFTLYGIYLPQQSKKEPHLKYS